MLLSKTECAGGTRSYRNLIAYGLKRKVTVALGTDFNGNTSMMGSRFKKGNTGCPGGGTPEDVEPPPGVGEEFVTHGLRHIGLIGDMMAHLRAIDPAAAVAIDNSAEAYLQMWERAWNLGGTDAGPGPMPVSQTQPQCVQDFECGAGKWCDAGLDLTKNSCQPLKNDNESCEVVGGGHQCKGGHCVFPGRCYTPNSVAMGGTCYTDDACKEGKCSAIDGAKGTCVCKEDSDCGAGKWCDAGMDTKVNVCRAKLDKGQSCAGVAW